MRKLIYCLCLCLCAASVSAQEQRPSTFGLSVVGNSATSFGFRFGTGAAADCEINYKRLAFVAHYEMLNQSKAFAASGTTFKVEAGVRAFIYGPAFGYAALDYGGWSSKGPSFSKTATRARIGGGVDMKGMSITAGAFLPVSDPNSARGFFLQGRKDFERKDSFYGLRLSGELAHGTFNRLPVSPQRLSGHALRLRRRGFSEPERVEGAIGIR